MANCQLVAEICYSHAAHVNVGVQGSAKDVDGEGVTVSGGDCMEDGVPTTAPTPEFTMASAGSIGLDSSTPLRRSSRRRNGE